MMALDSEIESEPETEKRQRCVLAKDCTKTPNPDIRNGRNCGVYKVNYDGCLKPACHPDCLAVHKERGWCKGPPNEEKEKKKRRHLRARRKAKHGSLNSSGASSTASTWATPPAAAAEAALPAAADGAAAAAAVPAALDGAAEPDDNMHDDAVAGPAEWRCPALHDKSFKQAYLEGFAMSPPAPSGETQPRKKRHTAAASSGTSLRAVLLCTGNLVDSSGEYIDPVVLGGGEVDVTALETQGLTPLQLQTSKEEAFDVSAIVQVTITHVFMPEFRSKVDGKDGYLDKPLLFGGLRDRPTGVPTDRGEVLNLDGGELQVD
ncbi:hypothetical protein OEZ85_014035 [Tetradesmus obliquus]|uniref:Uncharacterized protein n=1 Tax=Tetradesmus obliquus TaxID=3088 RepID=A0ABY8U733_TETOB|nr:hypothetical protein OEZ85_014035 [Tetradesmus obliquus]